MNELANRLSTGALDDAAGILRYAGLVARPSEAASAIAACYRSGLYDETSDLVTYVAQRPEREVLEVAKVLLDDDVTSAAHMLLARAVNS